MRALRSPNDSSAVEGGWDNLSPEEIAEKLNEKVAEGIRNAVETVLLCIPILFLCLALLPLTLMPKIIVTMAILVPVGGFALIGIGGDSLTRWLKAWMHWRKHRRMIFYRGEVRL